MDVQRNIQEEGIPVLTRRSKKKKKHPSVNSWYYFGLAGEIGFAVALPIAGGALIGSAIDRKLLTYPRYTILLLFIGIALSIINFIVVIQNILKQEH